MESTIIIQLILLVSGIIALMISGDFLIKGGVALANHFKISNLVIGLTVVAFGTSAPELIVSMGAAYTGHPEIALGNVIGSNIANIALVLALTLLIFPMPVTRSTLTRSWPVLFASALALYLTMFNNSVGHWEGALLFLLLLVFIYDSIRYHQKHPQDIGVVYPTPRYTPVLALVVVVLASAGLALGSRFLVQGASGIASGLGVSERIISLTIVAFGTSIPELTASVIAALKKESDISVGNIIGSNIFNVFAVIGLTSLFRKIEFSFADFHIDLIFMLLISLVLAICMIPWKKWLGKHKMPETGFLKNIEGGGKLTRASGILFLSIYLVYLWFILL
jgi:cation:H+ antiporter